MAHATDSSQDQLQRATVQLYEDESLTSALTDEAATLLLSWGEQQLKSGLAGAPPDQTSLDSTSQELRRTLRTVNRLVARRSDLSDTDLVQQLLKLMDQVIMLMLSIQTPVSEEPSHDQTTQTIHQENDPQEKLW
jgi:hypothetical protein